MIDFTASQLITFSGASFSLFFRILQPRLGMLFQPMLRLRIGLRLKYDRSPRRQSVQLSYKGDHRWNQCCCNWHGQLC